MIRGIISGGRKHNPLKYIIERSYTFFMPTNELVKNPAKQVKINKTDVLVDHFLEQGLTVTAAAKKVGISRTQASLIKSKLQKYKLTNPKALKKGLKVFDKVMDDFLEDRDNVKASDAVAIVKMQQDRIDPVKGNDTPQTVNYTVVNLALITPNLPDSMSRVIDNNVSEDKSLITIDNDSPTND